MPLSPAPSTGKDMQRTHRQSKSLTEEPPLDLSFPRPLPIPPTFTGNGRDYRQSGWTRDASFGSSQDGSLIGSPTVEDLPSNPKLWTPAQVSTYLYTALRVIPPSLEGGDALSISAVEDIIAFTREANINGRIFLRLIAEDLDKCVYAESAVEVPSFDVFSQTGSPPGLERCFVGRFSQSSSERHQGAYLGP